MIKNISVIGAGTMGNGIAHVFAQSGFNVTLIDVNQAVPRETVAQLRTIPGVLSVRCLGCEKEQA